MTITIDITSPVITINSPINHFNSSSATINYNYSITDSLSPNATCNLYVNSALNRTDTMNSSNDISFNINFIEGYHNWNLSCTDTATNTKWENTKNLTVDLSEPVINLIAPLNDTLNESSNNIDFKFNTTDAITGVQNCSLIINSVVSVPVVYNIVEGQIITEQRSISNGFYNWSVNCTDTVGITKASEIYTLKVNVTIDLDPPVVVSNSPEDNFYSSIENLSLYYTATDALSPIANCSLYLNDVLNETDYTIESGNQSNFTLTNFQDNPYNWSVTCIDNSTNNEIYSYSENSNFYDRHNKPWKFFVIKPCK